MTADFVAEKNERVPYRRYVLSASDANFHEEPVTVDYFPDGQVQLWVGEYSRHLSKAEREQLAALLLAKF